MGPHAESSSSAGDSQPALLRSYASTTAMYCDFGLDNRLAYSSGKRQLRWWHNFNQVLEVLLGRYGAVSAERSEEGVCGVFGVSSDHRDTDIWRELKAVQCALDVLDAIQEVCSAITLLLICHLLSSGILLSPRCHHLSSSWCVHADAAARRRCNAGSHRPAHWCCSGWSGGRCPNAAV